MAEVKWIKIVTDIFDDSKILIIEKMPESYAIIVAWFKLLCLAGKENNGGVFKLNDRIHYTDELLATIFRMPVNIIRLALKTFEELGMIEIINGVVTIPNWEKHQNESKLEEIREYQRIAKRKEREKKQQLLCQGHVVDCQHTDIDIEVDKDKKKKIVYAEFVTLTETEYNKLIESHGESKVKRMIEVLNNYKGSNGKKYKSDYLAILNWVIERVDKEYGQASNAGHTGGNQIQAGQNIKRSKYAVKPEDVLKL